MVAPGISSGDADTFAEFVDIYPTLCDLAGINIPLNIDGKSLVQAMENKKSRLRDYAVSQYPRKLTKEEADRRGYESTTIMGYSLRTERYRYTMWVHDFTTRQLFSDRKIFPEIKLRRCFSGTSRSAGTMEKQRPPTLLVQVDGRLP